MSNFQPQTYSESELARIVQHAGEDDHIDAKGPMSWDGGEASAGLAKDIAAFANSRDGGFIVVGKEETQPGIFKLTGLPEPDARSFDTTKVANWVNTRFSPAVHLTCFQTDFNGAKFVVIRIIEFGDIPVICTKRFDDPKDPRKALLEDGRIYVRAPGAQSKPMRSEGELRELVGLATKKRGDVLLQHFNAMLSGKSLLPQKPSDQELIESELKSMRETISARGKTDVDNGWRFFFYAQPYEKERWVELAHLEQQIQSRSVRTPDTFPSFIQGTFRTDWGIANDTYGEAWCLSRAGVFSSFFPFQEDGDYQLGAIREHVRRNMRQPGSARGQEFLNRLDQFRWIEYQWSIITVVKAFAFMSRFADLFPPASSITYRFDASPLGNRHLISRDYHLWFDPQFYDPCGSMRFSYARTQQLEELLATWQDESSLVLFRFFELFPGYNIARETLRGWVDRYLGKT